MRRVRTNSGAPGSRHPGGRGGGRAGTDPLFDTFGPLNPDVIGLDRWWETQPLDGTVPPTGWTVRFTAGWGDCQAGCIDRHSWTWNVTADGTVTFV